MFIKLFRIIQNYRENIYFSLLRRGSETLKLCFHLVTRNKKELGFLTRRLINEI